MNINIIFVKQQIILLFLITFLFSLEGKTNFEINSFIYQLQDVKKQTLLNTDFDIGIIDIDDANFSINDLQDLKNQNKFIVSYLSIGEAEDYRDYWIEGDFSNNPPSFLDEENPDFEGNFKVHFWDPAWQEIIFKRVNEIIDAGYDGVYLDIIDAYFYYEEKGRTSARKEMEDFVIEIARRAREKNTNFLIIPQNAPELATSQNYLAVIDGIGKEDTFFFDDKKIKGKKVQQDLFFLNKIVNAEKFVLATDYPLTLKKQCKFIALAKKNKLIPFTSNRDLNKIEFPGCGK